MPEEIAPPLSPDAPQSIKPESPIVPSMPEAAPGDRQPDRTTLHEWRLERMKKRTVLSDCIVMLRYALDEGCPLPDALITDIAKIDTILIEAGDDPLSERPFNLRQIKTPPVGTAKPATVTPSAPAGGGQAPQAQDAAAGAGAQPPPVDAAKPVAVSPSGPAAGGQAPQVQDAGAAVVAQSAPAGGDKAAAVTSQSAAPTSEIGAPNPDELLLRIHNGLSALVAPATAISLRATDPDVVRYGLPLIAKVALIGALVSTIVFIIAVANPRPNPPPSSTLGPTAPTSPATSSPASSPSATP